MLMRDSEMALRLSAAQAAQKKTDYHALFGHELSAAQAAQKPQNSKITRVWTLSAAQAAQKILAIA